MPRFLSLHSLACLTRQGADDLVRRLQKNAEVETVRVAVNLYEGKMLVEMRAENRESIEGWFQTESIHYDWLLRIELESTGGGLEPA